MKKDCENCTDVACPIKNPDESLPQEVLEEMKAISHRLCQIRNKVLILSGKGGVGKSTVAVNLAVALAHSGKSVGLLDVDIHGPSVPTMLGVGKGRLAAGDEHTIHPFETSYGLKMISAGLFLENENDAFIWRGPMKMNLIKQFIKDVEWGELDYLIIDSPPGTGDEPLSVAQLIGSEAKAVIVTTPQDVALQAVSKSITFCRILKMPILGMIENMSGYLCPHCNEESEPFSQDGGRRLALKENIDLLATIPLSPEIAPSGDNGRPVAMDEHTPLGEIYHTLAKRIDKRLLT